MRPWVLLVVAACQPSGVQIEVYAPADPSGVVPDEVRLYIGVPDAVEGALVPEDFLDRPRPGSYWARDPGDRDDVRAIYPPAPATFQYTVGSEEIGAIVAIGYAAGVPTSTAARFHVTPATDGVAVYRLDLEAAVDPRITNVYDSPNQLVLWGGDEPDACVHVLNKTTTADPDHPSAFIVRDGDRDCDELRDDDPRECRPDQFLGTRPAVRDELSCVTSTSLGAEPWCVLGGPPCIDGQPTDPARCAPSPYCAPTSLCTVCAQATMPPPFGCALDAIGYAASHGVGFPAHLDCTFAAVLDVGQQKYVACPDTIAVALPIPANVAADRATLRAPTTGFDDKLEIVNLRYRIDGVTGGDVTLSVSGETLGDTSVSGLLVADLQNGRHLALPVRFKAETRTVAQGCRPPQCVVLDAGDSIAPMLRCLQAP